MTEKKMSVTEERAAALQEILADWKQADPEQVWDAFDFEDFNEMVGDLAALLAEIYRLRGKLADAWDEGAEVAAADIPVWRTWADLEHIPDDVRAVTDADGDRAEPQVVLGRREWFFVADPLNGSGVSPDVGPFTEVLEDE